MEIKQLVKKWFEVWVNGDFENIPVTEDFKHTSPYGTIETRKNYFSLIETNRDKFLGNRFKFHDEIYEVDRACIRYTVSKDDFTMEVTEWHYIGKNGIREIVAYYNIPGEIRSDRKLTNPD